MRRFLQVLACAGFLSACAHGLSSEAPPETLPSGLAYAADASRVASEQPAGTYELDSRHGYVAWRVRHLGLSLYMGRFDRVSGTMSFDPKDPTRSTVDVTIDAKSLSTGLLDDNGERSFDRQIFGQVLGAEKYPQIRFVSKSIALTGPHAGKITGDLTLRGVTLPAVLDVDFQGGRYVVLTGRHEMGFTGRTVISRKAFGAVFGNPLVDGAVSDQVEILISAEFGKVPG